MPHNISDVEVFAGGSEGLGYLFWIEDGDGARIIGFAYRTLEEAETRRSRIRDVLAKASYVLNSNNANHSNINTSLNTGKGDFSINGDDGNCIMSLGYLYVDQRGQRLHRSGVIDGRKRQIEQMLSSALFVIDSNGKNHLKTVCRWVD